MTSSRLADYLVERYDLTPPVDVRALLGRVADVEELEWEFEVDGLVIGLSGPIKPRVLLKSNQPPNRMRFTIAHEWGHISIPWHVESLLPCHIGVATMPTLGNREREANEFASRILLPDRFIRATVAASKDPNYWLSEVSRCQVSAHAGVLALKKYLPSGYSFVIEQPSPQPAILLQSSGTHIVNTAGQPPHSALAAASRRRSSTTINGKTVYWYQHIDDSIPAECETSPTSSQLLERIVTRYGSEISPGRSTTRAINGVIGGKLRDRIGMDVGQMLGVLRYHLELDADFHQLLGDTDFDAFLAARVNELAKRDRERYVGPTRP
jgi:IrrE N-terminal-like domain